MDGASTTARWTSSAPSRRNRPLALGARYGHLRRHEQGARTGNRRLAAVPGCRRRTAAAAGDGCWPFKRPDAVYYGNVRIRASGRVSGGRFSRYRLMQQNICHQSISTRSPPYKRKPYDDRLRPARRPPLQHRAHGQRRSVRACRRAVSLLRRRRQLGARDGNFEAVKLAAIRKLRLPLYRSSGAQRLRPLLKGHMSPLEYIMAPLDDWDLICAACRCCSWPALPSSSGAGRWASTTRCSAFGVQCAGLGHRLVHVSA